MAQDVRPEAADSRRATTLVNLCFAASITSLLMEQPAHLLAVVEAACRRLGTLPMAREIWCKRLEACIPKHGEGAPAAHDNNTQDANECQRVRHACHWLRCNILAAVEEPGTTRAVLCPRTAYQLSIDLGCSRLLNWSP